ncbi:signal peptidase I [Streptomyces sp. NPDC007369]|uniref:signal peptidase I n=1 Tax=Streptomyces sp. NPDC007369 TaxID=3154589 RepID=UPI0033C0A8DB
MSALESTPDPAAGAFTAAAVGTAIGAFLYSAYSLLRRRLVVVTVQGLSMQPAFEPGDRVLVRRGVVPGRGGIVVVEQPSAQNLDWPGAPGGLGSRGKDVAGRAWLIKRVAALPGDPVSMPTGAGRGGGSADGTGFADGSVRTVPPGALYLLGDNKKVSFDSRQMGFFPVERVLGAVWRRL